MATSVGLIAGVLVPDSGCIIPDYCIRVENYGMNNCNFLEGAIMWPIGQPELAEPVPSSKGAPGPSGCVCLNAAEQEIMDFQTPEPQFEELSGEVEQATREACDAIVPAGWDHNCFIAVGDGASTLGTDPYTNGFGECVGSCGFANPPPGKSCPEFDPYECNGENGDGETGVDSGSYNGELHAGDFVSCRGTECEVDLAFAHMVLANPGLLESEGAMFVYDSSKARFVFVDVHRGSLAAELGLSSGDVLEAVNGTNIDDLDAALHALTGNQNANELRVRVKRSQQWVDFTYILVP